MGAVVAKQPKKINAQPAEPADSREDAKATAMTRLKPEFQKRLARVAKDAGQTIGQFIEAQLSALVNREYKRIVREEAEAIEGE